MRRELDDALVRDFPHLYADRHNHDTRVTLMGYGFPGDGWEPIIRRISERLESFASSTGVRVAQVKEKMGRLRYYLTGDDPLPPDVIAAIEAAEDESARTCEVCGRAGVPRRLHWLKTLCAPHAEAAIAAEQERLRRWREGPSKPTRAPRKR